MKDKRTIMKSLYETMVRIRLCEESLVEPILNKEVRTPCHLYSGQEAVAAGVFANLRQGDLFFGNHRSHGHYLANGGSMEKLFAEILGKETGCSRGRGGSMHLVDPANGMLGSAPIVAGTISLAVGAALAISIRGEENVSVAFFGDGATGEGVLYESLNFAALKKLPMVFVCENNLYSTHMPIRECRVSPTIFDVAEPFGMESRQVNGNDVVEVYETSREMIENCRKGKGPCFIECLTYRMRGHVGPDDNIQGSHTDIRPDEEIEEWRSRDCILKLEEHLKEGGLIDEAELSQIRSVVEQEVESAFAAAREAGWPQVEELKRGLFLE